MLDNYKIRLSLRVICSLSVSPLGLKPFAYAFSFFLTVAFCQSRQHTQYTHTLLHDVIRSSSLGPGWAGHCRSNSPRFRYGYRLEQCRRVATQALAPPVDVLDAAPT